MSLIDVTVGEKKDVKAEKINCCVLKVHLINFHAPKA